MNTFTIVLFTVICVLVVEFVACMVYYKVKIEKKDKVKKIK